MRQKLKDSHIPIVTAKENIDTLYNSCNAAGKQPEPLWPHLGQLEDQAPEATLRSSPKPEMLKEFTNTSN